MSLSPVTNGATTGALRIRGLHVERGTQAILRGFDLDVAAGELCVVMGSSGAGKSTVLRVVTALQPFSSGTVSVDGVALRPGALPKESALRALRERVGMVFQSHALFEHLTVLDNVMLAPMHGHGQTRAAALARATHLLETLGVLPRATAYPRELSGGEAQRVAIARALAINPPLLLMDEPTSALDPARRAALGHSLRALAADGRGLLIVTHDVDFARAVADRVVVLSHGIIAEQGPAAEVLP